MPSPSSAAPTRHSFGSCTTQHKSQAQPSPATPSTSFACRSYPRPSSGRSLVFSDFGHSAHRGRVTLKQDASFHPNAPCSHLFFGLFIPSARHSSPITGYWLPAVVGTIPDFCPRFVRPLPCYFAPLFLSGSFVVHSVERGPFGPLFSFVPQSLTGILIPCVS